jgi:hypothetical protein
MEVKAVGAVFVVHFKVEEGAGVGAPYAVT